MNGNRLLAALFVVLALTSVAAPALGQVDTAPAQLEIEQPRHVSEPVNQVTENGTEVYRVRGQYLEIRPENFNHSSVTSFSVREDEAVISFNKQTGQYILNNQGTTGTYHVTWTVSENNATRTYTATIQVLEADYAHVPADEYENLTQQNTRNAELIESIRNSGDPDTPVEQKVEFGNQVRDFANNPFSALTGQFMALQTIRFLTPAGWLDLGIIMLLVYGLTRGLYTTIARLNKQLEKQEKISQREDELYIKQFKSVLAGQQITDVDAIDDHQAAVLEDRLGTNLYTALQNFWNVWGADSLKQMYVSAMGSVGYRARVERDDAGEVTNVDVMDPDDHPTAADGGEPGEGDDPEDGPEYANLGDVSQDVVEQIAWEDVDIRVFQKEPKTSAVDHLMVTNRQSGRDLISDMNITIPEDFQSRENFMRAIGHFLNHVQETDFTDDENFPREDRALLNNVFVFSTVMEQEYDVPLDLFWRAAIWNAEGLDRDDEAESVLDEITDAGSHLDGLETDRNGGGGVGS